MTFVPKVLLRRLYKKGSLKSHINGVAFELKNVLGPGIINKINFIKINNHIYNPQDIHIDTNDRIIYARDISEENPIFIAFQQKGTLIMNGNNPLVNGINTIELELISREAGLINVNIQDNAIIN
ncbi:MAG: hypothetical protein AB1782_17530 [Cyanobacteriota bacterium]